MSARSNPTGSAALWKQIAHEAEHRTIKYDARGRRKAETLPPNHLRGANVVPSRRERGGL
jgi:hypothetical protein